MPRLKRKKMVANDETSLNDLIQEVYNDSHNIRSSIQSVLSKWEPKVKDEGNISAFGKEIVSLINALSKNQDQKINLLKILSEIRYRKNGGANIVDTQKPKDGEETISDDAKSQLRKMIEEERKRVS